MKKKVLRIVAVIVLLLIAGMFYLNHRNRTLSPPGAVETTMRGMHISVSYSRPSVRDRVIFGTEEQGALQPYGQYWRLGANESTEITFDTDVLFGGQLVKAGTYKVYAVPGPELFDVILSTETGTWGAMEPDHANDILHFSAVVEHPAEPVEQFTITLESDDVGVYLVSAFDNVRFRVPIDPASGGQ